MCFGHFNGVGMDFIEGQIPQQACYIIWSAQILFDMENEKQDVCYATFLVYDMKHL
jgi:hypothetical protein